MAAPPRRLPIAVTTAGLSIRHLDGIGSEFRLSASPPPSATAVTSAASVTIGVVLTTSLSPRRRGLVPAAEVSPEVGLAVGIRICR